MKITIIDKKLINSKDWLFCPIQKTTEIKTLKNVLKFISQMESIKFLEKMNIT